MSLLQPGTMLLVILAATGYAVATIGMKFGASTLSVAAIVLIMLGFGAAVLSEITVLRTANLGPVYIAIIGIETLLVMLYAWYIGEAPSIRQLGGASLVLIGLAVVGH